jgi:hypothetical protein
MGWREGSVTDYGIWRQSMVPCSIPSEIQLKGIEAKDTASVFNRLSRPTKVIRQSILSLST